MANQKIWFAKHSAFVTLAVTTFVVLYTTANSVGQREAVLIMIIPCCALYLFFYELLDKIKIKYTPKKQLKQQIKFYQAHVKLLDNELEAQKLKYSNLVKKVHEFEIANQNLRGRIGQIAKTNIEPFSDHALFGITKDSTIGEVRIRYKRLSQVHHPDHGGSVEMMTKVNRAYARLKSIHR